VLKDEEAQVWRCTKAMMQMVCPVEWNALKITADSNVRHCGQCDQDVHLCTTPDQFIELAKRNECVALPSTLHVPSGAPTKVHMLGRPSPWHYQLEQSAAEFWSLIERDAKDIHAQLNRELSKCETRRTLRMSFDDEDPH